MSVLLIGIGNDFRSDDAAGLHVVRRIKEMGLPSVQVKEMQGEGTSLMEAWKGQKSVYVVDAVASDSRPGKIHRLNAIENTIPSDFFHYSTHAFSLAEAVELSRALKQLPEQLVIYGIEGKQFESGQCLSPEIEKAVTLVTKELGKQCMNIPSSMI